MAAILFLVLFLVLGVGTVMVAMQGGPKGAKEKFRQDTSRPGSAVVAALIIIVFGVAVPVFVLVNNNDTQAKSGPGGSRLDASAERGRVLFARNCATCHTLGDANAVGKVGPNLDVLRPQPGLTLDAIKNGRARGQGQMPAALLSGRDATDVSHYVALVAGR